MQSMRESIAEAFEELAGSMLLAESVNGPTVKRAWGLIDSARTLRAADMLDGEPALDDDEQRELAALREAVEQIDAILRVAKGRAWSLAGLRNKVREIVDTAQERAA